MERNLLTAFLAMLFLPALQAQVTQINSNRSLEFEYPLSNNKSIFVSKTDQTIWATDGTLGGTIQLSASIKFVTSLGGVSYLDGKLIFSGNESATGTELYVTDGTPGGTQRIADINPGPTGSTPDVTTASLNGFLYFTAERPAEGRELWRTDGTAGGTSFVKDMVLGPTSSNTAGSYELFSTGSYLLLAVRTAAAGTELWKSDGTGTGTNLLKDINTGNAGAASSNPASFHLLNNIVLFEATSADHGSEIWKTDGTPGGTTELADINPGAGSSTTFQFVPGVVFPVFYGFRTFNNRAYFAANNGTTAGTLWSTDGGSNTVLVKNIASSPSIPFILLSDAINLPNKFIFPVADQLGRSELWQSDGTAAGTGLFMSFDNQEVPILFPSYNVAANNLTQNLFQGDKFFFMASTAANGNELWISDGIDATPTHTRRIKDINPGTGDGIDPENQSYVYTTAGLYFGANNGANGLELWKSDGTEAGTSIVADIVTGPGGAKINVTPFVVNGRVLFEADNGDNPSETDLYAVNGIFNPLPVSLGDFTVSPIAADALLSWYTLQELNTKDFTIQRSFDGSTFTSIGTVAASGASSSRRAYSFTDAGIMNSGKAIVYYRLLARDADGKTALSQVITLKPKNNGEWKVKVLSNPVQLDLRVLLSGVNQPVQLSVLDVSGKKLLVKSLGIVNGQVSLQVNHLPPGTYVLLAETSDERKVIQFVK